MKTLPAYTPWEPIAIGIQPGVGNSDFSLRWDDLLQRWEIYWSRNGRDIMFTWTDDPSARKGWQHPQKIAGPAPFPTAPNAMGIEVPCVVRWKGNRVMLALDKPGVGCVGEDRWRAACLYVIEDAATGGPYPGGQPVIFPSPPWAQPFKNEDGNLDGGIVEITVREVGRGLRFWGAVKINDNENGWGHRILHAATEDPLLRQWVVDPKPAYVERGKVDGAPAWWTVMQTDVVPLSEGFLLTYLPQWSHAHAAWSPDGVSNWRELGILRKHPLNELWKGNINAPSSDIGPNGKLYTIMGIGPRKPGFEPRAWLDMTCEIANTLEPV